MSSIAKAEVDRMVKFDAKLQEEILAAIGRLNALSEEYKHLQDPSGLDNLKRRFNSELSTFSELYAKIKVYKASTHTYLHEERKYLKARGIEILGTKGINPTNAKDQVYSSEFYVQGVEILNKLQKFFLKVELLHDRFEGTLQCIIQSVSVVTKDQQYNRAVGNRETD